MRTEENILTQLGRENAAYVHARGWLATRFLVEKLSCQPKENILEIGFGTGATLVVLASRCKESHFFGVETSKTMYDKGVRRIAFCGLSDKITCHYNQKSTELPFADFSMDKIYCESVLAIQEDQNLPEMLKEIWRVLKPNGKLIFNETIWLNSTRKEEILKINESCKLNYGIIQSNGAYPTLNSWQNLLSQIGFEVIETVRVDELSDDSPGVGNWRIALSSLFTIIGKIKRKLKGKKLENIILETEGPNKLMEGIIFEVRKNDLDHGLIDKNPI